MSKFLLIKIQDFGNVQRFIEYFEEKEVMNNKLSQCDTNSFSQKEFTQLDETVQVNENYYHNNTIESKVVFGKISPDNWITPPDGF